MRNSDSPSWSRSRPRRGLFVVSTLMSVSLYAACSSDDATTGQKDGGADTGADGATKDASVGGDSGAHEAGTPADSGMDAGACAADKVSGIYTHLSCTGLYDDIAQKKVTATARAYEPALTFWSDGANKSRWLSLPAGQKIDTTDMDSWKFPLGTKVWKEFKVAGKRIETRLLEKSSATNWFKVTYVWDAAEGDAVRTDDGIFPVPGTDSYEVPKQNLCAACHDGASDTLLGVEAVSLSLPATIGVTLDSLKKDGLLSSPPAITQGQLANDATTFATLALGVMHANCGTSCHNNRPNAPAAFTGMFVRIHASDVLTATPTPVKMLDSYITTVGVPMSHKLQDAGALDGAAPNRITSGDTSTSGVFILAGNRVTPVSVEQMPPIVSHKVDTGGLMRFQEWITAGP